MKESILDVHSGKCLAKSNLFRMLTLLLFALFTTTAFAQQKNIRGTVIDASGESLIGVNVSVKGTTIGYRPMLRFSFLISDTKHRK